MQWRLIINWAWNCNDSVFLRIKCHACSSYLFEQQRGKNASEEERTTWSERQARGQWRSNGSECKPLIRRPTRPGMEDRTLQEGAAMSDLLWGNGRALGMCGEVSVSWLLFEPTLSFSSANTRSLCVLRISGLTMTLLHDTCFHLYFYTKYTKM